MDSSRERGEAPSGQPGRGSSSRADVDRLLSDFRSDQQERKKRRDAAAVPKEDRRNKILIPALVVLAALTAWVWIAPPGFLRPEPLPEATEEEVRAGLNLDVYGAAVQVLRYREANGRLPASLEEVGEVVPAVEDLRYQRLSEDRFILSGSRGDATVSYDSSEPLADLVEPVWRQMDEGDPGGGGG